LGEWTFVPPEDTLLFFIHNFREYLLICRAEELLEPLGVPVEHCLYLYGGVFCLWLKHSKRWGEKRVRKLMDQADCVAEQLIAEFGDCVRLHLSIFPSTVLAQEDHVLERLDSDTLNRILSGGSYGP
jgi:hypothetical protein